MTRHRSTFTRPFAIISALAAFALVAGCDTAESDMGAQPKAKPQTSDAFFADGATARPLVAGTVPRDDADAPGMPHAEHRPMDAAGYKPALAPGAAGPFPITRDLLERGQSQYNISCSVCHGRLGNGDGMIVRRGFSRPPSFHVQRLKDAPDSHFVNVIAHGYGAMFSYSDRVREPDRWAIVAYIRALQTASDAPSLSAADRVTLVGAGDPNAPKGGGR